MSNYCVCCGAPIPGGQNTCSMCYGDPEHGNDGYYRHWLEEQARQHALEEQRLDEEQRRLADERQS